MNIITKQMREEREYQELVKTLQDQLNSRIPRPARLIGLCEGARNALFSSLIEDITAASGGHPVLLLVPDEKEAMRSFTALSEMGHTPLV